MWGCVWGAGCLFLGCAYLLTWICGILKIHPLSYTKKTNLGLIPIRWQLGHVQKLGFEILYKFHVKTSSMTSE